MTNNPSLREKKASHKNCICCCFCQQSASLYLYITIPNITTFGRRTPQNQFLPFASKADELKATASNFWSFPLQRHTIGAAVFPLLTVLNRAWLRGCTYSNQLLIRLGTGKITLSSKTSWPHSLNKHVFTLHKKRFAVLILAHSVKVELWAISTSRLVCISALLTFNLYHFRVDRQYFYRNQFINARLSALMGLQQFISI